MTDLQSPAAANAMYWDCRDSDYYADSPNSISNTDRECFRESPALFKGRVIDKLTEWQFKATDQMKFGTATHHVLFGTGRPLIIPAEVLGKNGARSTNAWREFEARNEGQLLITAAEHEAIQRIEDNIRSHKIANMLIFGEWDWARPEQAVRWICADTGLLRRSKLDRLVPDVIVDFKTFGHVPTAKNWASRVEEYGYARQAAYYQDATESLGLGRLPFVFVVAQTAPPFAVECFDLGDDTGRGTYTKWLDRARAEVAEDLAGIKAARDSGIYVTKTHGKVTTIQAPRWAGFEKEYE